MIILRSETDGVELLLEPGETVLAGAMRAGMPFASACNGRARCSTCRIQVLEGDADRPPETEEETALKARLGLGPQVRLACQFRPEGPLSFRRLVLDLTAGARLGKPAPPPGELRQVAALFLDVAGFTAISEKLPPHDVLFLLNGFLTMADARLARHGGLFDKAVGDGFVALFGAEGEADAPLAAVAAALDILEDADRARRFMKSQYGVDFDVRIGIDCGEALIGGLGPAGREQVTVIGEVANTASRVEQANKEAGTRLLVTDAVMERIAGEAEAPEFMRMRLRGATGLRTLHAVSALTEAGRARLAAAERPRREGGVTWARAAASAEVPEGGAKVLEGPDRDIVLARRDGRLHAFNNACPHLRLPLFGEPTPPEDPHPIGPESPIDEEGRIICRWHASVFDLADGGVAAWCPVLLAGGRLPIMPWMGDVSKNRAPLEVFPCREEAGVIWVGGWTPCAEFDDGPPEAALETAEPGAA